MSAFGIGLWLALAIGGLGLGRWAWTIRRDLKHDEAMRLLRGGRQ